MSSTDLKLRPFSFQPNNSINSSLSRGKAIPMLPITSASHSPPRFATNYESIDTPNNPNTSPRQSQLWHDVTRNWETVVHDTPGYPPQIVQNPTVQRSQRSATFPPLSLPPSQAFRQPPSSPTPPMTKSSQKILQLTGFDPRFERALPLEHQQLSPTQPTRPQGPHSPVRSISSESSSSFYSQAGISFKYEEARSLRNSSTSIAQSLNSEGEYLTPSIYNTSEHGSKSSEVSGSNKKTRLSNDAIIPPPPTSEIVAETGPQPGDEETLPLPRFPTSSQKSRDSNEIMTLPEILAQEQPCYEKGFEKDTENFYKHNISITPSLIPSPLSIHPKTGTQNPKAKDRAKPKHVTLEKEKKPSLYRTARDSLDWGIYDLGKSNSSSPSRSKYTTATNTPVSPMFTMESDHLSLSPPLGSPSPYKPKSFRRRRFGSNTKHPLKSPFPFPFHSPRGVADDITEEDEGADSMPSPSTSRTFKRRISDTIRYLSPASTALSSSKNRSSPPSSKKFVITNAARRVDGPATPMPPKHGFMDGVMKGRGVLEKVGKSVLGSSASKEEKRKRESLKKKIVVVGITDQSPDGRVAEWL